MLPKRIKERNEQGDVFSFGVIAWELFTRRIPWENMHYMDVIQNVKNGKRLEIPNECPSELRDLITKCWNDGNRIHDSSLIFKAPELRPTSSELVQIISQFKI